MAQFFSKTKGRIKLSYRTANWFRRSHKFEKPHPEPIKRTYIPVKRGLR